MRFCDLLCHMPISLTLISKLTPIAYIMLRRAWPSHFLRRAYPSSYEIVAGKLVDRMCDNDSLSGMSLMYAIVNDHTSGGPLIVNAEDFKPTDYIPAARVCFLPVKKLLYICDPIALAIKCITILPHMHCIKCFPLNVEFMNSIYRQLACFSKEGFKIDIVHTEQTIFHLRPPIIMDPPTFGEIRNLMGRLHPEECVFTRECECSSYEAESWCTFKHVCDCSYHTNWAKDFANKRYEHALQREGKRWNSFWNDIKENGIQSDRAWID